MDLALAMVAADHGMPLALKVAKRMVMVTKRSGGQSQFSRQLSEQEAPDAFGGLVRWMRDNLRRSLDLESLAQRMHMSTRHLRRRFLAAFGVTPQRYVDDLRIESAKALLEHTSKPLKRIAAECGFASEEAMRRAFLRRVGIRPRDYRQRFSPV
jgi:transcriptional regulator GlxA family with amidase domain